MNQFAILYEDRFTPPTRVECTTRMDAAVAVDAQNAPTATWKTAQNAVSHSAHTHHRHREKKIQKNASHTKFLTLPT